MEELEAELRAKAKELLDSGDVEYIIGYEYGADQRHATPAFFFDSSTLNQLVLNSLCFYNLTRYLLEATNKVAIVAKPCDVRGIIELIVERQLKRDHVVIISFPCAGVIDSVKIENVADFEPAKVLEQHLADKCLACSNPNPLVYDILLGDKSQKPPENIEDEYKLLKDVEALSLEERHEYWQKLFSRCIRCFACRNICPICYCSRCIVESTQPQWVSKSVDTNANWMFHVIRAFHSVGRCIDCGACEQACPMRIPVHKLSKKLEEEVRKIFGYQAGVDLDAVPPLATFSPEDTDEHLR